MKKETVLQAVCVIKQPGDDLLYRSYALTIVDGKVVSRQEITRGPDRPSIAIGASQRILWQQSRVNNEK